MDHSLKTMKEYKNLKNQRIRDIFVKTNKIGLAFNMTWLITDFDEVLQDKTFNIAEHQKYDGYRRGLASMVYSFFDKTNSGSNAKSESSSNQKLNKIIRKFEKWIVHLSFIDNIWSADLAETPQCI